ncbi:hypothetical protein AMS68_003649 [Peltaster fructicola]|uniref:Uncharacterized protein n=1 Tax=Peltaster fructicola TaxID=286661 RepID=A0A6H0XTN3_9PEZI|nr:hypothetical protein AMS68_003649 [Peltaster fructicola]
MIPWQTVQALLLFFGPWMLPRLFALYRSLRSRPASVIKPLPRRTSYALWILFASGLIAFLSTLPLFAQENVYRMTHSRLQTPAGVLMTRLAALRALTIQDERLRSVLDAGGLQASLLYARYGPAVLRDCPFAHPGELDSSTMYLLYAAPAIAMPHVLHLFALATATSGALSDHKSSQWRTIAFVAGIVLGLVEAYFLATYDDTHNQQSVRVNDIDFVHWKVQVWRGLAIAAVDGLLGWAIWLQATGRAFLAPPSAGEKLAEHTRLLETTLVKTRGLGVLRNATMRSSEMRQLNNDYWRKDEEVMRDVFEEPAVLQAQRNALSRMDITRIGREADQFVDPLIAGITHQRQQR